MNYFHIDFSVAGTEDEGQRERLTDIGIAETAVVSLIASWV